MPVVKGVYAQEARTEADPVERFNAEHIEDTLWSLGLPNTEYFVIGGANLVLRGLVEDTPDIDMLVSDEAFENLRQHTGAVVKDPPLRARQQGATNQTAWIRHDSLLVPVSATTALGDGYYPMSFESHKVRVDLHEDHFPILALEHVIASKVALQRPNDLRHLHAIMDATGITIELPAPTVVRPVPSS